jgi:hypothetical protein
MTTRLWAVYEMPAPWDDLYPWRYRRAPGAREYARLHGAASDVEVATIVASLCISNNVEPAADLGATLDGLLLAAVEQEGIILAGGPQLHGDGPPLSPGCCYGVEDWPEWQTMAHTGRTSGGDTTRMGTSRCSTPRRCGSPAAIGTAT